MLSQIVRAPFLCWHESHSKTSKQLLQHPNNLCEEAPLPTFLLLDCVYTLHTTWKITKAEWYLKSNIFLSFSILWLSRQISWHAYQPYRFGNDFARPPCRRIYSNQWYNWTISWSHRVLCCWSQFFHFYLKYTRRSTAAISKIHIIYNDIAITANIISFQVFNNNKPLIDKFKEIRIQLNFVFVPFDCDSNCDSDSIQDSNEWKYSIFVFHLFFK